MRIKVFMRESVLGYNVMRIGLTGGIACGKSTVLLKFEELGWSVLKADDLAKEILQTDATVHNYLFKIYGDNVFIDGKQAPNQVNTSYLASKVFSCSEELRSLESLLHPKVRELWQNRMSQSPKKNWMIEIPLLFEKGLESLFDQVICVSVDTKTQMDRLLARGLSKKDAKARIDIQWNISDKIKLSHLVLSSTGNLQTLYEQVNAAHQFLIGDNTPKDF